MKHQIDDLDKKILRIISQNARTPFLEVARKCGVSGAAIHQRIQKLQAMKVIKGSQYIVDTYQVGYQTCAYIGLTIADMAELDSIINTIKSIPEIVECHYTTGRYAIFVKIFAHDNRHLLDLVVDKLATIKGVGTAETFLMSLDEVFNRQLNAFDPVKKRK